MVQLMCLSKKKNRTVYILLMLDIKKKDFYEVITSAFESMNFLSKFIDWIYAYISDSISSTESWQKNNSQCWTKHYHHCIVILGFSVNYDVGCRKKNQTRLLMNRWHIQWRSFSAALWLWPWFTKIDSINEATSILN